ncbi:hypothetical protein PT974_09495 [Cladobotryum mycophilum]|uniref:Uncharacterized protein n=1 Tax=Cladobotryum mycophilum TaxID=491253 RepID=A0ABR0SHA7_9HYPO
MHFSKIVFAVLPALALAQAEADTTSTTTCTSTTIMTKTVTLARVHTVTAGHNATSTGGYIPSSTAFHPTAVPTHTKGPENAGSALDAGKVALAGFAGMLVVAMM